MNFARSLATQGLEPKKYDQNTLQKTSAGGHVCYGADGTSANYEKRQSTFRFSPNVRLWGIPASDIRAFQ